MNEPPEQRLAARLLEYLACDDLQTPAEGARRRKSSIDDAAELLEARDDESAEHTVLALIEVIERRLGDASGLADLAHRRCVITPDGKKLEGGAEDALGAGRMNGRIAAGCRALKKSERFQYTYR